MLFLKANGELKAIFTRLIQKMDVAVRWGGVFAVTNHSLVLVGETRSLIFNYDNKRVYSDLLDLPLEEGKIEEIPENPMLTSLFNMTLYAFGKWGSIKGVRVNKGYGELNELFQNIVREIRVEPSFQLDGFRFQRDGVPIAYEDLVELALQSVREPSLEDGESGEEYEFGLWHNVCWKLEAYRFLKRGDGEREGTEAANHRIGKNFYRVDYLCPACNEDLYMTVYPDEVDVRIETGEGIVHLARAYACHACHCFYTPKPGTLLGEGEAYHLDFDEDKNAYEDYLEHLGKRGARTTSFRYNEYESDRRARNEEEATEEAPSAEDNEADGLDGGGLSSAKDGTQGGSWPLPTGEGAARGKVREEELRKPQAQAQTGRTGKGTIDKKQYDFSSKTIDGLKAVLTMRDKEKEAAFDQKYLEAAKAQLRERLTAKFDARMKTKERMSQRQLSDFKKQVQKEMEYLEGEGDSYVREIDELLYRKEKESIGNKLEMAKNKPYAEIARYIEELERGEGLDDLRKDALERLKGLKSERGRKEVEGVLHKMSLPIDRKRYEAYLERIRQYEDVDLTPYKEQIEEKRNKVEKDEIALMVKRADKEGRVELLELCEQLRSQGFNSQNVEPYLEKIKRRIQKMDEEAIAEICPNISTLSFHEGLKALDKVAQSLLLPELKEDAIKRIRERITKIKTDENRQLVKKLKKALERKLTDFSRIHFYDVRDFGEDMEPETVVIARALNRFAASRNEFEYPIVIGDATKKGNGKRGFVLTPDYLYYKSYWSSGKIGIMELEGFAYCVEGWKKGIFAQCVEGEDKKIPHGVKEGEREPFAEGVEEFIKYLQEKPESRNLAYLVKEQHAVTCCFRCGYTYQGGKVCPKCGNKNN